MCSVFDNGSRKFLLLYAKIHKTETLGGLFKRLSEHTQTHHFYRPSLRINSHEVIKIWSRGFYREYCISGFIFANDVTDGLEKLLNACFNKNYRDKDSSDPKINSYRKDIEKFQTFLDSSIRLLKSILIVLML